VAKNPWAFGSHELLGRKMDENARHWLLDTLRAERLAQVRRACLRGCLLGACVLLASMGQY
jgi:hypothetical protein